MEKRALVEDELRDTKEQLQRLETEFMAHKAHSQTEIKALKQRTKAADMVSKPIFYSVLLFLSLCGAALVTSDLFFIVAGIAN